MSSEPNEHRIGIGGIAVECSTFSPLPTTFEDFERLTGDAMIARYPFMPQWDFRGRSDIRWLPCLHARAIPGGEVNAQDYETLKGMLLERIAANVPMDGFYLDIHGAMKVSGRDDAEADLARAVRAIVGPDCLVVAGMDLHGNVSRSLVEQVDLFTAYRLAPHDDAEETRERACRLLVDCLDSGTRPIRAWVRIPVILPGERTSTLVDPGRSVYAELAERSAVPGVLDASLWVGYVWADEPRTSASVVVTGTDNDAVRDEAEAIARRYWDTRQHFDFGTPAGPADWCIEQALKLPNAPVVISDSGDNPTAGGAGDVPFLLERILSHSDFAGGSNRALFASIPDPRAVRDCFAAGEGADVALELGGKLDSVNGQPLRIRAVVVRLFAGDGVGGDIAVVRCGGVDIIVTTRRKPHHYLADFTQLGLLPEEYKVIAVKIGYLVPEIRDMSAHALLALTPGAVNQDIRSLPFERVTRPVYPLDEAFAEPDLRAVVIRR